MLYCQPFLGGLVILLARCSAAQSQSAKECLVLRSAPARSSVLELSAPSLGSAARSQIAPVFKACFCVSDSVAGTSRTLLTTYWMVLTLFLA